MELADHKQAAMRELEEAFRHYQDISNRCAGLEAEVSYCREQLERSRTAVEGDGNQSASGEAPAMNDEDQRKLEALIGELERELDEGKSQLEALAETNERLRETERICQELGDENRRLREEIARWQQRFAAGAGSSAFAHVEEDVQPSRGAAGGPVEQNMPMEEPTAGADVAHETVARFESDAALNESGTSPRVLPTSSASGLGEIGADLASTEFPSENRNDALKPARKLWQALAANWHIAAVFAGVVVFVAAGVLAMKILFSDTPTADDPELLPTGALTAAHTAEPAAKASVKAAPPRRGAFQTVRPTQVFNGPSEKSALIANLGAGVKVNVVDARGGWLEIRSKHGRPPGFIREEAAVRVGAN
jgi:hypothetical protein